jgi:hypothetical protein
MSDRYATRIRAAITEGRELTAAEAEHLAGCNTCRDTANGAHAFATELESALALRRAQPLPADPLVVAPPLRRRSWTTAVSAAAVVLFAIGTAAIGSQLVATPGPSPSAEPSTPSSGATASPTATSTGPTCDVVAPRQLPSGGEPGTMRRIEGEIVPIWEWGAGDETVRLAANHPAFSGPEFPPPQMFDAVVRGNQAAIQTVGDTELSEITLTWMEGPCTYTLWVGPGLSVQEAQDYGSRY